MQRTSWPWIMSAERTVQMTCTSFLKPFGQSGRIGRSIMRAVRVARSDAFPSRLKKPPGIFPAAYIFSSTSIGQREEVRIGAGLLPADGRREDHRVAGADDDCAVGLLGELAGLERDLATTDLDRHRGLTPGCDAHMCVPFTLLLDSEGGGLSQSRARRTRDSIKHPPSAGGTCA